MPEQTDTWRPDAEPWEALSEADRRYDGTPEPRFSRTFWEGIAGRLAGMGWRLAPAYRGKTGAEILADPPEWPVPDVPEGEAPSLDEVAHVLRLAPEVHWDRMVRYPDSTHVYGWLPRDDGRSDFVLVEVTAGPRWQVTTSAANPPEGFWERFQIDMSKHVDCERVRDLIDLPPSPSPVPGGDYREYVSAYGDLTLRVWLDGTVEIFDDEATVDRWEGVTALSPSPEPSPAPESYVKHVDAGDGEEQDRHNSAPEIKVGQVWRDKPGNTLNGVPAIHDWEITSVGRTVRARCVDCVDAWNCMGDLESWPDRHVLVNPVEDGEG